MFKDPFLFLDNPDILIVHKTSSYGEISLCFTLYFDNLRKMEACLCLSALLKLLWTCVLFVFFLVSCQLWPICSVDRADFQLCRGLVLSLGGGFEGTGL